MVFFSQFRALAVLQQFLVLLRVLPYHCFALQRPECLSSLAYTILFLAVISLYFHKPVFYLLNLVHWQIELLRLALLYDYFPIDLSLVDQTKSSQDPCPEDRAGFYRLRTKFQNIDRIIVSALQGTLPSLWNKPIIERRTFSVISGLVYFCVLVQLQTLTQRMADLLFGQLNFSCSIPRDLNADIYVELFEIDWQVLPEAQQLSVAIQSEAVVFLFDDKVKESFHNKIYSFKSLILNQGLLKKLLKNDDQHGVGRTSHEEDGQPHPQFNKALILDSSVEAVCIAFVNFEARPVLLDFDFDIIEGKSDERGYNGGNQCREEQLRLVSLYKLLGNQLDLVEAGQLSDVHHRHSNQRYFYAFHQSFYSFLLYQRGYHLWQACCLLLLQHQSLSPNQHHIVGISDKSACESTYNSQNYFLIKCGLSVLEIGLLQVRVSAQTG